MLRYIQRPGERSWFARPEGISPVLHRLLMQRGVSSAQDAEEFLHPGTHQLHDPFLLNDMAAAAGRIRRAMENGERICVWGDYDVDGVCASSILFDYFRSEDADVEVYLPSRHSEGYGLNEEGLKEISCRCSLLITVDCGISSHELIETAKALGLDCIVTDHHRPGDILPDCPVVNPLLGDYPFPWLCGAGVAFKLVQAVAGTEEAMERIDLAAIATVADVVSLTGENRAIVYLGLKSINTRPRPGVAALMECARLEAGQVSSEAIGFRIGPRLNAGGRLGSARRSFDLLTQQDAFLAVAQADELEQENNRRQSVEREIRAQAEAQLEGFDFSAHRILLVRGAGWNHGVIGLAASHLKEKYHYPVIVMTEEDGQLVGSCRSIPGVDIYEALSSAAELMVKYGGHSQAAGLTIKEENFEALQAALDSYLFENVPQEAWLPCADYDIPVNLGECSEAFVRELAALEPTGCGNPEPVFRTSVQLIEARAIGAQGAHLRLIASEDGVRRTCIYFGAGDLAAELGENAEILFTPQINSWNGRTDVQLRLSALRQSEPLKQIDAAREQEELQQRNFLTEMFYNRGINHSRTLPRISTAQLKEDLAENPQGTWILCADYDIAARILRDVQPCMLDISAGRLPCEPRAFNSLVICPQRMDEFPKALRRLVLAGVPPLVGIAEDVECVLLDCESELWSRLPDVDQMREVYKAAMRIMRRPVHISGRDALDMRISEEAGLEPLCCRLSLLALADMQLVEIREKPFALRLPPMKKTDPDSSALWRSIQQCKTTMEGRDSRAEQR